MEQKALSIIEDQSWELNNLVNKLIWFSTFEAEALDLDKKETGIDELVAISMEKLGQRIKDDNVKIDLDDSITDVPKLMVDPDKMREVFDNIIENAIKFNDKPDKKLKIRAFNQHNNFVRVEIEDNGIGIPSEEQNKIFQKFYQIEIYFTGQVKGTGLGLALSKRIVEEHEGSVWVESKMGEYSKFVMLLPKVVA
jgi:signal transduction histidine kinase